MTNQLQATAPRTSGSPMRVKLHIPGAFAGSLSADFLARLQRFNTYESGWDGFDAEPIALGTTRRARLIAFDSLIVAIEPFVAPAADGSVLLKWDLPNGVEVEYFVPAENVAGAIEVSITDGDVLREVHLPTTEHLRGLLQSLSH